MGFSSLFKCCRTAVLEGYTITDEIIGSGAFGTVKKGIENCSGACMAVKIIPKTSKHRGFWSNASIYDRETSIIQSLSHPFVVKLEATSEDRKNFYSVMPMAVGGELFEHISRRGAIHEMDVKHLAYQIVHAVAYVHSNGILHRDIKAENFLFIDHGHTKLMMIDFGMSERVTNGQRLRDVCGSPHYLAPELVRGSYSLPADIWSLGVLIYLMLYGRYPFDGEQDAIIEKIKHRDPDYRATVNFRLKTNGASGGSGGSTRGDVTAVTYNSILPYSSVPGEAHYHELLSNDAIFFMKRCMRKNPRRRATAHDLLLDPWFDSVRESSEAELRAKGFYKLPPRDIVYDIIGFPAGDADEDQKKRRAAASKISVEDADESALEQSGSTSRYTAASDYGQNGNETRRLAGGDANVLIPAGYTDDDEQDVRVSGSKARVLSKIAYGRKTNRTPVMPTRSTSKYAECD